MRLTSIIPIVGLIIFLASCSSTKTTTKAISSNANEKNPSEKGISSMNRDDIKGEELFVEGCHLNIIGQTQQALNIFNQCLQANAQNDAVMYEIASIYNDTKDYNKAATYILQAIKLNPSNKWYKVLALDILEKQNENSKAADIAQQLASQNPDDLDYEFDRAYFLSKAGEYEKAIGVYNQIEAKTGVTENISVEKQKLWDRLHKQDKAIDEIVRLKNAYPTEPRYVAMLADLYMTDNMQDKAFGEIQQLAQLDSTNSQAQFVVADYYRKQGNWEKSFFYLERAFHDPTANIDNEVQVVLSYFPYLQSSGERKQEAITLAKLITQMHPADAKAYSIYGDVLNQVEMDKEALDAYKKSVSLDAGKFMVWEQELFLLSRLEQNDSLLKISQHVIELFPDQPLAYYYNGIAREQAKQYPEAIRAFSRVLAMGTDDGGLKSQIYASLGDCYHFTNDNKVSDSCYEQSISFDPANVYALNNYSYYLAVRGEKLEEAERLSSKVVYTLAPDVANYLDTYAWVLYKLKRYSEAKTWMDKALANSHDNNAALFDHYGDILFQLGDTDNAVEYWKRAKAAGEDNDKIEKKINDRKLYE
jgi:tetratricopeptide (TPR) repeat protein